MTTTNRSRLTRSYESIKLGIDAHAKYHGVSRSVHGATPKPVHNMTYEELLLCVLNSRSSPVTW
jgi:hypothetical protein